MSPLESVVLTSTHAAATSSGNMTCMVCAMIAGWLARSNSTTSVWGPAGPRRRTRRPCLRRCDPAQSSRAGATERARSAARARPCAGRALRTRRPRLAGAAARQTSTARPRSSRDRSPAAPALALVSGISCRGTHSASGCLTRAPFGPLSPKLGIVGGGRDAAAERCAGDTARAVQAWSCPGSPTRSASDARWVAHAAMCEGCSTGRVTRC